MYFTGSEEKFEKKQKIDQDECVLPAPKRIRELNVEKTPAKQVRRKPRSVCKKRSLAVIAPPDVSPYSICWIKIRGYNDWPGVIEREINGKYEIHFFGDYSRAIVGKAKITNFFEGFSLFHNTFDAPLLKKAIKEACICLIKTIKKVIC